MATRFATIWLQLYHNNRWYYISICLSLFYFLLLFSEHFFPGFCGRRWFESRVWKKKSLVDLLRLTSIRFMAHCATPYACNIINGHNTHNVTQLAGLLYWIIDLRPQSYYYTLYSQLTAIMKHHKMEEWNYQPKTE